jgi:hypothetical protein
MATFFPTGHYRPSDPPFLTLVRPTLFALRSFVVP